MSDRSIPGRWDRRFYDARRRARIDEDPDHSNGRSGGSRNQRRRHRDLKRSATQGISGFCRRFLFVIGDMTDAIGGAVRRQAGFGHAYRRRQQSH
jgi:hypothetical protein